MLYVARFVRGGRSEEFSRMSRFTTFLLIGAAGVVLTACNSTSRALGVAKVTPDEFRVIAKAPLVVPPDYALRPPAPGEPRPQELQPESAARQALIGQRQAQTRSTGEALLVQKAGGERADPLVRYVVDDEFGDLAHKEKSFADRVMFWRKDQPQSQPSAAAVAAAEAGAAATPLDPAAEAARVAAATGGQPVVIARERRGGFKLPGL
jgi:hypothetical protein